MTLRKALHDYMRDNVDVAVHDGRLPTRPMMPALVQRFISGRTIQTMSNRRSLLPRRVEVSAYANNDVEVDAVATRLLYALDGYHGPMNDVDIGWIVMLNDSEMPPDEVKGGEIRYRRVIDFEIAYQELPSES